MSDGISATLLEFFTDEGDWAYVMDYEKCGIVAADVTDSGPSYKRIVIRLQHGIIYDVIRVFHSPVWEVYNISEDLGGQLKVELHTTRQLFNTFKRHD